MSSRKENLIKWLLFSLPLVTLIALLITSAVEVKAPKVAFIRSADLVDDYLGMKEMRLVFEGKQKQWGVQIDSLEHAYKNEHTQLEVKFAAADEKGKLEIRKQLMMREQQIRQMIESIQQTTTEEDEKLTQGVLNQVNSFIKEYAERHGIDLVLGTTRSGNILYGQDYMDITEEVTEELNEYYLKGAVE